MVFQTPTSKLVLGGSLTFTCAVAVFTIGAAPGPVGFGTVDCAFSVQTQFWQSVVPSACGVLSKYPQYLTVPPEYETRVVAVTELGCRRLVQVVGSGASFPLLVLVGTAAAAS